VSVSNILFDSDTIPTHCDDNANIFTCMEPHAIR
jgi:hypothetical protein